LAGTVTKAQWTEVIPHMTAAQLSALKLAIASDEDPAAVQAMLAFTDRLTLTQALLMFGALTPQQQQQITQVIRVVQVRAAGAKATDAGSSPADQLVRLLGELRGPVHVERRPYPGTEAFFRRYWATNTPVVLDGFQAEWRARARWSPQYFRDEIGEVEVDVVHGREADPDHDIHFQRHSRTLRMNEYLDAIERIGTGNDLYMIGNNRNLERPELRRLWDDLAPPTDLIDSDAETAPGVLWIGPEGTITKLHHDQSNILLCQITGRKRVWLAPPSSDLWKRARGLYNRLDAESEADTFAAAGGVRLELDAGECLFIPVGWWHQVRALAPSISVGMTGFRRPNAFPWFQPGALGQ
jgi:hypothetical protein